jgi:serine/threonine protein kinase/TolA-binding protein
MLRSLVAMATEVDERVGSLVDERYRIIEPMAEGSMGAVYKAERVPVGKLVAIKFLHATYANDAEFLARFERETRVMSKLAHPNCVSVVDFGVWEGAPYLVMEYVGGRTLRKILDEGALPAGRALVIARQIVSGLAHAHAQGITHRDVKPANIMISEEIGTGEHVRILDFGLARLRGAVGRDATQHNVVVGTPNYMAPEQTVGGGIIDARTDIYAVGVVLFEMVAGERPFQAEDTLALLGMHRAAPVPRIADRVPAGTELPEGLQAVVEKALAKSPDERYPSAIALAEAIDKLIGRPHIPTDPRGLPVAKQVETLAVAPTLLDVGSRSDIATVVTHERPFGRAAASLQRIPRSTSRVGVFLALIVLGGGAYAAYYLQHRDAKGKAAGSAADGSGEVAQRSPEQGDPGRGSSEAPEPAAAGGGSADPAAAGGGSSATPEPSGAGSGSAGPTAVEPAVGSAGGSAVEPPAAGSGAGSAVEGELEAVPPPEKATNPDPAGAGAGSAEDEDENAPKTQEDIEKRPKPATPALATTIAGAVKMVQDGKRDLALASLQALYQKQPKSAYIPFLLGNLYYDQRWWSVSMDNYRTAISRNGGYRTNAVLIRNVIRMLISKKTDRQAEAFLRRTIGRPALPYLQQTAKSDPNLYMRKYAAALVRQIR